MLKELCSFSYRFSTRGVFTRGTPLAPVPTGVGAGDAVGLMSPSPNPFPFQLS